MWVLFAERGFELGGGRARGRGGEAANGPWEAERTDGAGEGGRGPHARPRGQHGDDVGDVRRGEETQGAKSRDEDERGRLRDVEGRKTRPRRCLRT